MRTVLALLQVLIGKVNLATKIIKAVGICPFQHPLVGLDMQYEREQQPLQVPARVPPPCRQTSKTTQRA